MSALQALLAAAMFGLSVPLAKRLLDTGSPLFLAGLLYLGAGLFLTGVRAVTRSRRSPRPLEPRERVILVGVVLTGGSSRRRFSSGAWPGPPRARRRCC